MSRIEKEAMDVHFDLSVRTRSEIRDRPDFMVLIVFLWRATSCGVCGSKRSGDARTIAHAEHGIGVLSAHISA